jgi:hypothetical protein
MDGIGIRHSGKREAMKSPIPYDCVNALESFRGKDIMKNGCLYRIE